MSNFKQSGGGLTSWDNIQKAWETFEREKWKKPDVAAFKKDLKNNLNLIQKELNNKAYRHGAYTTFYVKDPKLRKINKACVRDRVVHHLLFRKLYWIFERAFIFDSYSCRLEKGTHRAVRRLHQFFTKESRNNTQTCYVLKCDIRKFFDNVDQNILLGLIKRRVKDEHILWLIEIIIKSFAAGLPLGNITSQLFANMYLHELDQFVKQTLRVKYYIRYCDDFVILSTDRQCLTRLIPQIDTFLQNSLKLSLHPNKVTIRKYYQGIDFLGYVGFPYHSVLRVKTKKRMFQRITEKNKDSYLGTLTHCNAFWVKQELLEMMG